MRVEFACLRWLLERVLVRDHTLNHAGLIRSRALHTYVPALLPLRQLGLLQKLAADLLLLLQR